MLKFPKVSTHYPSCGRQYICKAARITITNRYKMEGGTDPMLAINPVKNQPSKSTVVGEMAQLEVMTPIPSSTSAQ